MFVLLAIETVEADVGDGNEDTNGDGDGDDVGNKEEVDFRVSFIEDSVPSILQ